MGVVVVVDRLNANRHAEEEQEMVQGAMELVVVAEGNKTLAST